MKNKLLTLLIATMLTGSLLVGCGGTETGAGNGGNTNNEATNSDVATKIDPNIEYTETQIAYLFVNEADMDKSLVDGTQAPYTTSEHVSNIVKVNESVNLYNINKENVGCLKPSMIVQFVQIDETWCGVVPLDNTEAYYVLATDIMPFVELVENPNVSAENDNEKAESNTMSDKTKAYFDKIRQGVNETNAYRKSYVAEHPEVPFTEIIETNSLEGMEFIGGFDASFDDEQTIENAVSLITFENNGNYTQYYLEIIKETDNSVEFYIYAK